MKKIIFSIIGILVLVIGTFIASFNTTNTNDNLTKIRVADTTLTSKSFISFLNNIWQ